MEQGNIIPSAPLTCQSPANHPPCQDPIFSTIIPVGYISKSPPQACTWSSSAADAASCVCTPTCDAADALHRLHRTRNETTARRCYSAAIDAADAMHRLRRRATTRRLAHPSRGVLMLAQAYGHVCALSLQSIAETPAAISMICHSKGNADPT
jgi:hypothetical protein